jgi:hypothetical protein
MDDLDDLDLDDPELAPEFEFAVMRMPDRDVQIRRVIGASRWEEVPRPVAKKAEREAVRKSVRKSGDSAHEVAKLVAEAKGNLKAKVAKAETPDPRVTALVDADQALTAFDRFKETRDPALFRQVDELVRRSPEAFASFQRLAAAGPIELEDAEVDARVTRAASLMAEYRTSRDPETFRRADALLRSDRRVYDAFTRRGPWHVDET